VQILDVHKRFGRTRALEGVSIGLQSGVTGLVGPNGAGKTTLLQLLATVAVPHAGSLRLLGYNPADSDQRTEIRRRLGYLPQELRFHLDFTAFEFVDYVAILKEHADRRARHREVSRVLEDVDLAAVAGRKIRSLSFGMRKRVALAQALLGDPRLLLLDEPIAGLDPEQRLHLRDLLSRLGEDRTIVGTSHQIEHMSWLCDRVVVMRAGTVRWDGTPQQLAHLAHGRVWLADRPQTRAWRSWRTQDGYRHLGDPPGGVEPVKPTIEDGYLLLLSEKMNYVVA
jgi:ABC-2 type transport system ATP-binding protein